MKNRKRQNGFVRTIKKFLLSAFVVVSFSLYALENRATAVGRTALLPGGVAVAPPAAPATGPVAAGAPPTSEPDLQRSAAEEAPIAGPPAPAASTANQTAPIAGPPAPAASTANQTAPAAARGGYVDGTYTGPSVDVNWGLVQVRATIQGGKISNVQFLQYPNDRRTSQRINSFAVPTLQQEAVQVQSANVDLITGATLTSEGFQMSLQAALSQAKG